MSPEFYQALSDHPAIFVATVAVGLYYLRKALIPLVLAVVLALMALGLLHLLGGTF